MKRSAGVTVIAVVALLGSVLAMCFGILSGLLMFLGPTPTPGQPPAALLVFAGAIYFLPGVWGLLSGIGLIRLKNWARISSIVFGSLLILVGGFSFVIAALMSTIRLPPSDQVDSTTAASVVTIMRAIMGALALAQIGLGVWWVVFLTRPKVAQQFTGGGTATGIASRRPISITIIAWLMLLGVPGAIVPLVMHSPVPFFVTTLSGLPAAAYIIALAVVMAYCGVGLLRLQPTARLVAIGSQVFGLMNSVVFGLAPGGHARIAAIMEQQQAMMSAFVPGNPAPPPFDPATVLYFSLASGAVILAVGLYFLVTRKQAFTPLAQ